MSNENHWLVEIGTALGCSTNRFKDTNLSIAWSFNCDDVNNLVTPIVNYKAIKDYLQSLIISLKIVLNSLTLNNLVN